MLWHTDIAQRGVTITSGLATGIDGASHRGAVAALGGTVAVLGSGLDMIFPREHTSLAAEIVQRGVLVSEYAPGVEAQKLFFPQRNRIIAGLTLGTLVVEATRRSGSLFTARLALDYGREVFAIPGVSNGVSRPCDTNLLRTVHPRPRKPRAADAGGPGRRAARPRGGSTPQEAAQRGRMRTGSVR